MNCKEFGMRIIPIAALALVATACTPNDVTMGGALKHDMALQTIDPEPSYHGTEIEGGSGVHAAAAAERYRRGTVKQPISIETTSGSIGSGGSK
jgi:protein-L-isoaspartate O-methyltransferase